MRGQTAFAGAATVLVLAATVAGLAVIGPPWKARELRLDQQRVRDLQGISAAVERHAAAFRELPATLEDLQRPPRRYPVTTEDPVTGEPYEYRVGGPMDYELCARFDAASEPDAPIRSGWDHPAGRHCYELVVPPSPPHTP